MHRSDTTDLLVVRSKELGSSKLRSALRFQCQMSLYERVCHDIYECIYADLSWVPIFGGIAITATVDNVLQQCVDEAAAGESCIGTWKCHELWTYYLSNQWDSEYGEWGLQGEQHPGTLVF